MMSDKHLNRFLYGAILSADLLSFNIGNTLFWPHPLYIRLEDSDITVNPLSDPISSTDAFWIKIIAIIGYLQGAIISGLCANKAGRKKTLIVFSIFTLTSYVLCAVGENLAGFLTARFLLGFGTGSVFTILPSYVAEVATDSNRGALGSIMGMMVTVGIASNNILGTSIISMKVLCLINLIPLIIFYLSFCLVIPDSPYYYASYQNFELAEKSLQKFRRNDQVDKELFSIAQYIQEALISSRDLRTIMKSKAFMKELIVSCGLLIFQQVSAMHHIMLVVQNDVNITKNISSGKYFFLVTGIIQVIACFIPIFLVDKLGRKFLLILSALVMCLSLLSLGIFLYLQNEYNFSSFFWVPNCSLLLYLIGYNIGFSSIPWLITAEIFSWDSKYVGTSISASIWGLIVFINTFLFPYLKDLMGIPGFICLISTFSAFAGIFLVIFVPETKRYGLMKIHTIFGRD